MNYKCVFCSLIRGNYKRQVGFKYCKYLYFSRIIYFKFYRINLKLHTHRLVCCILNFRFSVIDFEKFCFLKSEVSRCIEIAKRLQKSERIIIDNNCIFAKLFSHQYLFKAICSKVKLAWNRCPHFKNWTILGQFLTKKLSRAYLCISNWSDECI